jgi:hypothetical protein
MSSQIIMTNKIPFKCLQRYLQKSELYPSVNTNSLLHYKKLCYLKTVLFLRIWFDLILEGSNFTNFHQNIYSRCLNRQAQPSTKKIVFYSNK